MNSFFKIWFIVTICVYLVATSFSVGFHHPDEHYQIIDYVRYLLGQVSSLNLTSEFNLHIRHIFQPLIYTFIAKFFYFSGGTSPFLLSFFFRFLSAITFVTALFFSGLYLLKNPKIKHKKVSLIVLAFIWYLPYFAVRPSSDTLSAAIVFLTIAILLYEDYSKRSFLIFSVCSGFAYLIRYQTALIIAPIVLSLLLSQKISYRQFGWGFFLFVMIALCEPLFNYVGYHEFVFTSFQHAYQNIFNGLAKEFGVMPVWGYFQLIGLKAIPPFSLLLFFAYFHLWRKKIWSPLAIGTLCYFIVFSFIGHKEIRFLMPLVFLSPLVVIYFLNDLPEKYYQPMVKFLLVFNFIILPFVIFSPAYKPIKIYEKISTEKKEAEKIYVLWDNFSKSSKTHLTLELDFYKQSFWKESVLETMNDLKIATTQNSSLLLVTSRLSEYHEIKRWGQCLPLASAYPEIFLKYNWWNWANRSAIWFLWRCEV